MRVLVVEDEKKLAGFMRKGLEEQGFAVTVSHDGNEAYTLACTQSFDLIVLDIMLPGRDVNVGADDYITKPFYMDELLARIHAVLRRTSGEQLSVLRSGDLTVNLITREVRCKDEDVGLAPREFGLLEYLMRSPGRVFTRSQILEHVWGYGFDPQTNLVDVCVQRLRSKIDGGNPESRIETVRGVGYRFRKTGAA